MEGHAAWDLGQSLGLFLRSTFFALFCFWCSNRLHTAAFSDVLMAPIAFFLCNILSVFVAIAASVLLLYVWTGMHQRPSA